MCPSTLYFVWTLLRPYEIKIMRLIPIICNYTLCHKNVNYHLKADHKTNGGSAFVNGRAPSRAGGV